MHPIVNLKKKLSLSQFAHHFFCLLCVAFARLFVCALWYLLFLLLVWYFAYRFTSDLAGAEKIIIKRASKRGENAHAWPQQQTKRK